jgi:hypothetical protein
MEPSECGPGFISTDGILFSYKSNVLISGTPWMELENIMLREISQAQKANIAWFYLCELSRIDKFIETES